MSTVTMFDVEVFFRLLEEKKSRKAGEMRQGVLQNDLTKTHLALGAELCCEEIARQLRFRLDTRQRREEQAALHQRARRLRDQQRQLANGTEAA